MINNDSNTTIQKLKEILKKFRDNRDWLQFHDPKNIAEAIIIEAGELLEMFLWKGCKKIEDQMKDKEFHKKVEQELADIIIMCLNFANSTGIDVAKVILEKLEINEQKYPIEKAKSTAKKYTEL